MFVVERLLDPGVVWVLIPLAGICLGGVLALAKLIVRHRERMAKIGMGIDPDSLPNLEQPQPTSQHRADSRY
jgi:hypothetical protein